MKKTSKKFLKGFLKSVLLNIIIFSAALVAYLFAVKAMQAYSNIFYPLQLLEAKLIYLLQRPFAFVELSGTRLLYYPFAVNVSWDCLGIRQSLFFLILVFSFYQVSLREKLKSLYFIPLIIIANILRIASVYPFFVLFGLEAAESAHNFLYAYGNGIFILALFALWFWLFGLEECKKKGKGKRKGN